MVNLWKYLLITCLTMAVAHATPATDQLIKRYISEGAKAPNATRGKAFWVKHNPESNPEKNSCQACHGDDLTKTGKHTVTQKLIQPMSPHVNNERFTDAQKIEKWFKRNCQDVWQKECTSQEKADILSYLLTQ